MVGYIREPISNIMVYAVAIVVLVNLVSIVFEKLQAAGLQQKQIHQLLKYSKIAWKPKSRGIFFETAPSTVAPSGTTNHTVPILISSIGYVDFGQLL